MRYWFASVSTLVEGYKKWSKRHKADPTIDEMLVGPLPADLRIYRNHVFHFGFYVRANSQELRLVSNPGYQNVERVRDLHRAFEHYIEHFMI
jgi:hypothetical protein